MPVQSVNIAMSRWYQHRLEEQAISTHAQFVEVGQRRVFVRYAGEGATIVLLHQSPQNSRALLSWIDRLSTHYAVIAPDTPGFGFSDPLPIAQPTIPDYANALKQLLDTLGVERALIYGVHTGAVTALRFALDFPHCVAGLVCDGYARFTTEERQKLLDGYLPPFEPSWDGTHLLWLWSRLREQNLFFPWNDPTRTARLAYPAPSAEKLHSDVMDVLDAGDGYRIGYRAPFLYDDATAASRLTVPTKIFYRSEDVLAPHLRRLHHLPANVTAELVDGGAAALIEKSDAMFKQYANTASIVDLHANVEANASTTRKQFLTSRGVITINISPGETKEALIVLHDLGMPAKAPVDAPFGAMVITPELPGHGASGKWEVANLTPAAIADAIIEVLDQLSVTQFTLHAEGASGAIAAVLAAKASAVSKICRLLCVHNPIPLDDVETSQFLSRLPDAASHITGAHLIAAWQWVRMKHLFWPWLPQDGNAARKVDAPAPLRLHGEMREIVRAGAGFAVLWRNSLAVNMVNAPSKLACPIEITVDDEPERIRLATRLVNALKLQVKSSMSGIKSWQK